MGQLVENRAVKMVRTLECLERRHGDEIAARHRGVGLCIPMRAEFGFDGDLRHAGYTGHWIELLNADKRAFFTACSRASKAAEYLRGLVLVERTEVAA